MEFDSEGRRISKTTQVSVLLPKKRGRGRPRKYTDGTNTEAKSEPKGTSETKIKLKLLENILGVYNEIKNIENENQKNIKKFYTLVEGLD